jgi:transposase InsO family protein
LIKIRGRYGIRRVHRELLNRGYLVNHKRVQRLMHNMGLLGKRPKERYHSYKGNVADNIINRILMRVDHYKNGLLMYLNSILHGENVIFLQY